MPDRLVMGRMVSAAMLAKNPQRTRDLRPGPRRGVGVEVGFVDDDQVRQLHHPFFDGLQVVARVRQLHQHEHVRHAGHRDLALADADGFHDHDVVTRRLADQHGLARLLGDAAQRPARRAGTDEGALVHRELLHPRLVAQDRTARHARRGIDREHGHAMALPNQDQPERFDERAFADTRHAADAEAKRLAGVRQQRREHFVSARAMVRACRLEQRDRLRDRAPLTWSGRSENAVHHVRSP
jgi:hypothetical protein